MPGVKGRSGRKPKYEEATEEIHFQMENSKVEKLNILAKKYTKNNRSDLILQILERFIKSEFE